MIRLLSRTITATKDERIMWQQADIGRDTVPALNFPTQLTNQYNCYFCYHRPIIWNYDNWVHCQQAHGCNNGDLPYIRMSYPIPYFPGIVEQNEDGTYLTYSKSGVFRQVKFEAMPYHAELYLCNNGHAKCNANCWWHAWRLDNKRTWRQCGSTHLCQNDGSAWALLAPHNEELRDEFIQQL